MYSITVSHYVMIAHSLVGAVFGPAQQLHGATYVVEAELRREALDADGIVCDIGRALDLLKTVLGELDYRNLDEMAEFRGRNATTEFLAGEIHSRLARRVREGALGPHAAATIGSLNGGHGRRCRLAGPDPDLVEHFARSAPGRRLITLNDAGGPAPARERQLHP